jgi:hypothetical protein
VPVPAGPQTLLEHWLLAEQAAPAASKATQVPEAPGFMQTVLIGPSQSALEPQLPLQAVMLWQTTPPAQAIVAPPLQVPVPLQVPAAVIWPLLHCGLPHEIPGATCSQTPPAAQLPSLPQGGLAVHCPAGAATPAVMLAHVPFAWPVRAIVHAWQVPLHATLQQVPETHWPLWQFAFALHDPPLIWSTQTLPVQTPLWQSPATAQPCVAGQSLFCASH